MPALALNVAPALVSQFADLQLQARAESEVAADRYRLGKSHEQDTADSARFVLADLYETQGRHDIARLWRDELPAKTGKARKRVDSMTAKEKGKMDEWARRWIAVGLATGAADRPLFEAAVTACYRYTGLRAPHIVWTASPLIVALAAPIAAHLIYQSKKNPEGSGGAVDGAVRGAVRGAVDGAVGDAVRGAVDDAVRGAVDDAVRGAVDDAVDGAVRGAVDDAVDGAVRGAVRGAVDGAVDGAVRGAVGDAVRGAVDGAVRGAVRGAVDDAVRGAVDDAVRGAVDDNYYRYIGGQFWVGSYYWYGSPSYVSFMLDVMRLGLDRNMELRARAYAATSSACWWWPARDFVIVSERPNALVKDAAGKLEIASWDGFEVGAKARGWREAALADLRRKDPHEADRIERKERR